MPTHTELNRQKGKVTIMKSDRCRLENFDTDLNHRGFYYSQLVHFRTLPNSNIDDRYSYLVGAVINMAVKQGVFLDEDCLLLLRAHDLGTKFPILSGPEFEAWFLQTMGKVYEEIIQHLEDDDLDEHSRVLYLHKGSTFYVMTDPDQVFTWQKSYPLPKKKEAEKEAETADAS